jgi:hypothetical protein
MIMMMMRRRRRKRRMLPPRTGAAGDDVEAGAAAAAPVLLGGAVDRLLRGRHRVHRRHQALLQAEVVVDDLRTIHPTINIISTSTISLRGMKTRYCSISILLNISHKEAKSATSRSSSE